MSQRDASELPSPKVTHLRDYRPPAYRVETIALHFDLREDATTVLSTMAMRRGGGGDLRLDGSHQKLLRLAIDGRPLEPAKYALDDEGLTVPEGELPGPSFTVEIESSCEPQKNTALEGLYKSGGNYCTQCEAEGFRRITFFPDRPDVLAKYTTTIEADRALYPVLLSNGNLVEEKDLGDGRHRATWEDPFPKPSYLFALVAGKLEARESRFRTKSGRDVLLQIWVRKEDLDRTEHAMRSLQRSMKWDEDVFGLEYDLDRFMIVAVSDFNLGAMENKGLNIFNTAVVLARPDTATDLDYQRIEGVVAHEYFHNWTGNRITCRDWFQLSLKEGLTVYRDQEFSADVAERAVKRIADVRRLRAMQFPEDAGPTSHPIRPESYVEINNFYTPTVYEKGAEVVRMIEHLLGKDGFLRGMRRYVEKHDGQAATCEDFVVAMEEANGADLSRFRRWYSQSGTPELAIEDAWDEAAGRYTLTLSQSHRPTAGQPKKEPLVLPIAMGLVGETGEDLAARLDGEASPRAGTRILVLDEPKKSFVFEGLRERPTPSVLRGFSAPVLVKPQPRERLFQLFSRDSDAFTRWDAGQQLGVQILLEGIAARARGEAFVLDPRFVEAVGRTLDDERLGPAFVAEAITLPTVGTLIEQMAVIDPAGALAARRDAARQLARAHRARLLAHHGRLQAGDRSLEAAAMGRRALKSAILSILAEDPGDSEAMALVETQALDEGALMTDRIAGLQIVIESPSPAKDRALARFHAQFAEDPLVLDKWFALQASAPSSGTPERVRALAAHPDFTRQNPNRARSVIGSFGLLNPVGFHTLGGDGYAFLADEVLAVDRINPVLASKLSVPLGRWQRVDPARQELMKAQLRRIQGAPGLSRDVREMVEKALG